MTKNRRKAKKRREGQRPGKTGTLDAAMRLHRSGKLLEAQRAYLRVLELQPDSVQAICLLGLVKRQLGQPEDAIGLFRRAVSLQPDHAEAISEMAKLLQETGRLEEAAEALRRLIALKPDLGDLYNNLGVVLRKLGRLQEAKDAYARAVELNPNRAETQFNLGNVLSALERHEEAAGAYRQAIALKPDLTDAHRALASVLRSAGKLTEAGLALREWLHIDPDDPVARHMASALSGENTPARASDDYVRSVFDKFAATFDDDLQRLGYQGPRLITDAVMKELGPAEQGLAVLDAGCGTGLCASSLRPIARQLVGVDLSARMIDRARELNLYDEVVVGELTEYLSNHPNRFDLIVAADTFVYFGALEPLLAAAAGALRDRGLLIHTLERCDESASILEYVLKPNGRYHHSEDYVRRCLAQCNLAVRSIESAVLRTERGQPVTGLVVRAQLK